MGSRTRRLRLAAASGLSAVALGGLLIAFVALYARDRLPPLPVGLLLAGILAAIFAALLPWWRRLDHMERDSHLTSWYWGGSFGGGLCVLLLLLADRSDDGRLVAGAALLLVGQVIGYATALVAWWLAHRARTS